MAKLQIVLDVIVNAMKALAEVNDEVSNIIQNTEIDIDINAQDDASDDIDEIKKKADELHDEAVNVKADADTEDAKSKLQEVMKDIGAIDKESAEVEIKTMGDAEEKITEIRTRYEELKSLTPPELAISLDDACSKEIDAINAKVAELSGLSPTIKAMVDSSAADELGSIQNKADDLDGLAPLIKPVVDADDAIGALDTITNKVEGLDGLSGVIAGAIGGIGLEQMLGQGVETATGLDKAWRNWVGSLQQSGKSFSEATKGADRFKSKVNELAAVGQSNDSMFKNIAGLAINLNNNISDSTLKMTENVVAGYEMLGARSGATIYEMEKELKNFLSTGELGLMQDTLSSLTDPKKWIGLLEGADTVDERIKVLRDMMEEEGIMGALNIDAPSKSIDLLKATFEAKMTDIGTNIINNLKPLSDFFLWLDELSGGVSTTIMTVTGVITLLGVALIGIASTIMTIVVPGFVSLVEAFFGVEVAGGSLSGALKVVRSEMGKYVQKAGNVISSIRTQIFAQNGLINSIKNNSVVQAINNRIEQQRNNIKKQNIRTSISQAVATWAESVKLQLLNGHTSVAALYEENYRKAKERSLIASIKKALANARETITTGALAAKQLILTSYTRVATAVEEAYIFIKKRATLENLKAGAAKLVEGGRTLLMAGYTRVAAAAEKAYTTIKNLQILTILQAAAAKGAEYAKNILVAGGTLIATAAEKIYNFVKNQSILTTIKDIALKGVQALANIKTAITAGIATAAQIGLNAAMMATPYALVILGIIALVAAFKHLYSTFPDFKNGIDEITAGLKELFGALMSGDFDKIGEIFKNAWDKLPEWLGNIDQQIQPAIQSMIDAFSNWASKIDWIGELQKGIGNLTSWIYGAALNLANWLVEGLKNFSTGLTEWLDGGGAGGQEVGQSLYDGIVAWWNENSPMLWELFDTVFMTLLPLMGEIGWKLLQALGLALLQALTWVGQQIWIAWEENVSKPFWDWLNGIPGWIATSLTNAWNSFVGWLWSLPGQIWTFFTDLIAGIFGFGSQGKQAGSNVGSNVFNGVINFIKKIGPQAITFIWDLIKGILGLSGNSQSAGSQVGRQIKQGVIEFVSKIPEMVKQEFIRIGQNILAVGGQLYNKAKQVGEGIWKSLKGALGISSPGFMYWLLHGEWERIKENITNQADILSTAVSGVGDAITSSFNPSLNVSGAGLEPSVVSATVDTSQAENSFGALQEIIIGTTTGINQSIRGVNTTFSNLTSNINTSTVGLQLSNSLIGTSFDTLGSSVTDSLNNIANSNRSSWDNVNGITNKSLQTIHSTTANVTQKMNGAWKTMGTSLVNTANSIRTQSYNKFNSLHKSISSFYNQLSSARFSSGSLAAGPSPIGSLVSLISAPFSRGRGGGRIKGGKTTGGLAAGPMPKTIKGVSSKKIFDLLTASRTSKKAKVELDSLLFSNGITMKELQKHPFGSLATTNSQKIYNTGREWNIGDPYFLGIRIPTDWQVKDFESGQPSLGNFETILRQILTARGFSNPNTYDFYFGNQKSNQSVWDSVSCNCMDGEEMIGEIARMLGANDQGSVRGSWGGIPHRARRVNGQIYDMTQFQKRGVFRGSPGVSFGSPDRGNGIFDTMVNLLEKIADFFKPTTTLNTPVLDMNTGSLFNPANGQSVGSGDITINLGGITTGDTVIHIDNSKGDLDEEKIAKLSAEEIEKSLNDPSFITKLVKALQSNDNKIRRYGGRN